MKKEHSQQKLRKSRTCDYTHGLLRNGRRSIERQTCADSHGDPEQKKLTTSGTCPRCQGFMIQAHFMDLLDLSRLWGTGWRCLNCGVLIDSVIIANKAYAHPSKSSSRRPRPPKK